MYVQTEKSLGNLRDQKTSRDTYLGIILTDPCQSLLRRYCGLNIELNRVLETIQRLQIRLGYQRSRVRSLRCQDRSADFVIPERLIRACDEAAARIRQLEGELSKLETRRQDLQDQLNALTRSPSMQSCVRGRLPIMQDCLF